MERESQNRLFNLVMQQEECLHENNLDLAITTERLQENTDATTRTRQPLQDLATVMEHFQEESIDVVKKTECIAEKKNDFTSRIQPICEDDINLTMQHPHEENTDSATKTQHLENEKIDHQIIFLSHNKDENLLNENNKIKIENADLRKIIELLQKDNTRLELMTQPFLGLQRRRQQVQQLQQEKSQLENENQELRREKRQSENENQQLRRENRQSENDNRQLRQEKSQLQNDNQQLRQEKCQWEEESQQHRHQKNQSENENQQLRQEKGQLHNENQQLRQEKNQSENENQQLRQEKSELQNENQQLKEEKSQFENENQHLREENDGMSNEVQDLRQKNNNMEIEIQQLHEYTMCSFITESGTVIVSTDHVLGKGAWGAVYTGDFYGTKVAVKEYYEIILSPHNLQILQREVNIASQCRHPNLLQFICATKDDQDRLLIVTEMMDMALRAFLEQQAREKWRQKNPQVKLISLDVARGLNYLHLKKPNPIIHRDVSSANVLLSIENGSVKRAKISDYGSANFMQACKTANPGAALYAAPEASQVQHDPKVRTF